MTDVLHRLRQEAAQLLEESRGTLTVDDQAIVAERLDQYAQLVARAWSGEEGLEGAIAARRRSLDQWRTAMGAVIGDAFSGAVSGVLGSLFTLVLRSVSGADR